MTNAPFSVTRYAVVIHEIVVGLVAAAGGAVMSSAAGIVVAHGCEVLSDYVLYIHK
jgi:hypothetical protein